MTTVVSMSTDMPQKKGRSSLRVVSGYETWGRAIEVDMRSLHSLLQGPAKVRHGSA